MLSTMNFVDIHNCLKSSLSIAQAAEMLGESEISLETYLSSFRCSKFPGRALTFEEWHESPATVFEEEYGAAAYLGPINPPSLCKEVPDDRISSLARFTQTKKHLALVHGQSLESVHRVVSESENLDDAAATFETSSVYLKTYFECFSYEDTPLDYATMKMLRKDQLVKVMQERVPPTRLYIDSLVVIHRFCQRRSLENVSTTLNLHNGEMNNALHRLDRTLSLKSFQQMSEADLRKRYGASCDRALPPAAPSKGKGIKRARQQYPFFSQKPVAKSFGVSALPIVGKDCHRGGGAGDSEGLPFQMAVVTDQSNGEDSGRPLTHVKATSPSSFPLLSLSPLTPSFSLVTETGLGPDADFYFDPDDMSWLLPLDEEPADDGLSLVASKQGFV